MTVQLKLIDNICHSGALQSTHSNGEPDEWYGNNVEMQNKSSIFFMLNIFLLIFHLILRWHSWHRFREMSSEKSSCLSDRGSLFMCIYLWSGSWFVSSPPGLWGGEGWYRRCSADISSVALTLYVCCFRKGKKTQGLNEIWQTRPKKTSTPNHKYTKWPLSVS